MKQHRNIITFLLGLGILFWCQNLLYYGPRSNQPCLEGCGSTSNHEEAMLLSELQQQRLKIHRLEMELSRLREGTSLQQQEQQRIAIMFTGAPRTLTQLGVLRAHVVNVIGGLSAGGRDVVDVFFHLNNGTADSVHASQNIARARQKPFTQEILDRVINMTFPVEVVLHTDSSCSGLDGQLVNHSCCTYPWSHLTRRWQHNFLQFAFLRDSYRRVKQYERDNNITYDWFVRMRPDVGCFEPMPAVRSLSTRRFYLLTKERESGGNTNDYLFVVPKRLSYSFFEQQLMTIFDTTCHRGVSRWPAEGTMFTFWPKLPYQAFPFPCVHVINPTSAECFRMRRRINGTVPTVYDVDGSLFDRAQTFTDGCNALVQNGYFGEGTYIDPSELGDTWRR